MSTKKESDKTTTRASGADDTARVETTAYRSPTSSLSEQHHSVETGPVLPAGLIVQSERPDSG